MSVAANTFSDAPKQARLKIQDCTARTDGKKNHSYVEGICKFCGFKNPNYKTYLNRQHKEKSPNRPSVATVSQAKARSIIFGAGALSQRLALQLIEEEKRGEWEKDALSAEELLLLSDALADEAIRSKTIMAWLAALDKAGPHAKLATVVVILALPRMARHGMIPEEVASELANAAALAMASGAPRDDYRGDLRGQVDISGRGIVTTPDIPAGEPEQNGSSQETGEVPGGSGGEESYGSERREIQPDRTEAEPTDHREPVERVLPRTARRVAARRMDSL
jgi:hypothetical protein